MNQNTSGGDIPSPLTFALELHEGGIHIMLPAAEDGAADAPANRVIASKPRIEDHYSRFPQAEVWGMLRQGFALIDEPDHEHGAVRKMEFMPFIVRTDCGIGNIVALPSNLELPVNDGVQKQGQVFVRRAGEQLRFHPRKGTFDYYPSIYEGPELEPHEVEIIIRHNAELPERAPEPVKPPVMVLPEPKPAKEPAPPNQLTRHSLLNSVAELAEMAGGMTLITRSANRGEAQIFYAPPGSAKTLLQFHELILAVQEGRLDPDKIIYLNFDDSLQGLADKAAILQEVGIHMIAQGLNGFRIRDLIPMLEKMIEQGAADDLVIIINTVKKVVDQNNKPKVAAFAELLRRFCMKGGTAICLSHTTKRTNTDGTFIHAGTTDLMEDLDNAYILEKLIDYPETKERVVLFQNRKMRGATPSKLAYAYSVEEGISYLERLSSVRSVDPEKYQTEISQPAVKFDETEIVRAIEDCVAGGINQKMVLACAVRDRTGLGRNSVIKIIERLTGTDPAVHRWNYVTEAHGAHVFHLLEGRTPI